MFFKGAVSRDVYFPAGCQWFDFYSKKAYEGGKVYKIEAPLSHLPLFVKENSVIAMRKNASSNVYDNLKEELEWNWFGEEHKCEGEVYLDDGLSREYEKGGYGLYQINSAGIVKLVAGNGYSM